ncbi:hypothetical protein [Amycolatopsis sp. 3B14]|uniref:hypothetical protein n=1 Tax=Amycolatopsis sp. 3B14 TaxID=3243600 RepID=UPI003D9968EF
MNLYLLDPRATPQDFDLPERASDSLLSRRGAWAAAAGNERLSKLYDRAISEIRGSRLRLGHLVERLLERGIRTGVFQPTTDNALLAKVLLSTWTEVGRWYHPGGHLSVPDLADEFAVLALRTAGAAAPISVERFAPA